MTKKETEAILNSIETAYYRAYKNENNPLMWARASALISLAIDGLKMDFAMVYHRKNLGKVAAQGMEKTA